MNKDNENKNGINKAWYRWGLFLGGAIYWPKLLINEHRSRKEREKVLKGIKTWKKLLDEMRESGAYDRETLDNVQQWLAEACVQYGQMFNS